MAGSGGSDPAAKGRSRFNWAIVLVVLFTACGLTHSYWMSSIRADHPQHPVPELGYSHPIREKALYYVNDFEFYGLTALMFVGVVSFVALAYLSIFSGGRGRA